MRPKPNENRQLALSRLMNRQLALSRLINRQLALDRLISRVPSSAEPRKRRRVPS
jgi:hypothetical protein